MRRRQGGVSRTLTDVATPKPRLARTLEPDEARNLPGVVSFGGPGLAASALAAGLVDELD